MRHVALTIRAGDLDDVLDRLLPLVPQGVHELPAGEGRLELGVYGDAPGREALEAAAGEALVEIRESEEDDDPERRRLEAYARMPAIGGRVVVRPEAAPPAGPGLLDVVIEGPGGAFGAGTHPTTVMCLELLLGLEPGGAFADLGCGTGVLAIVAAELGWAPVLALDHEQTAVDAAWDNARRNGVEVEVMRADLLEIPPPPAPTLAANVMVDLHARIAGRLAPETTRVIASGIVDEHLPRVAEAYAGAGLAVVAQAVTRSWAAALLVRDG
jgi:ribosomal protein L11 methyltransferase